MKNFYIAIQTINESNKKYSYVLKVGKDDNLLTKLKIPNIVFAKICQTKKASRRNCSSMESRIYKKSWVYV